VVVEMVFGVSREVSYCIFPSSGAFLFFHMLICIERSFVNLSLLYPYLMPFFFSLARSLAAALYCEASRAEMDCVIIHSYILCFTATYI